MSRSAIEAAGIKVVENCQLDGIYWLPMSRLIAVPPGLSDAAFSRWAAAHPLAVTAGANR